MIYNIWAVSVEFHFVETPYCSEFKYLLVNLVLQSPESLESSQ